jgi:hypothetical protein
MHRITQNEGNLITVRVSGRLNQQDYEELIPAWERVIREHGSMRMLFIMENFSGWNPRAAWEDLRFSTNHARQVERVAMVGEKTWQEWLTKIGAFLVRNPVKYFDSANLSEAERWVRAD